MTTLYRKYRPSTFSSVTGQEHVVTTIENEIKLDRVAHAYLFCGPRGVGKTTMARLLAKAINCEKRKKGDSEPCNECSSCQEIANGRSIDVIEIDAASQTGVDNVRENIIENAQFKPTKSPYKVFIIDEVHMLSTSAFNALLKTLEEPPAHVIFILATTELHKLPATIISRCQRFTFKKIPHDLMLACLQTIAKEEKVSVEEDVLDRIINKSDGCLRDAESLLGQLFSLNLKKITSKDAELILPTSSVDSVITFVERVVNRDTRAALEQVATIAEEGVNWDQFAYDTIEALRSMMYLQTTGSPLSESDYNKANVDRLQKMSQAITAEHVLFLLDRLLKRRQEIKSAPLPQLPLELWAAECAGDIQPSDVTTPAAPGDHTAASKNSAVPIEPPAAPKHKPIEPHSSTITGTIKNAIAHLTRSDEPIVTTVEQIKNSWNDLINKIATTNPSLTFVLHMSRPERIEGSTLWVTVPYSLHKEKLEEHKNRHALEQALEQIFAEKILLACTVAEAPAESNTDLQNLATEFGGEIVN